MLEDSFVLNGHPATVRCLAFDPVETSLLVSGGIVDPAIRIWNVARQQ
jgi:WD40 repeat protein